MRPTPRHTLATGLTRRAFAASAIGGAASLAAPALLAQNNRIVLGQSAASDVYKRQVPSGARVAGPRHNSLRALRPLRSDRCRQSVHEARCARP